MPSRKKKSQSSDIETPSKERKPLYSEWDWQHSRIENKHDLQYPNVIVDDEFLKNYKQSKEYKELEKVLSNIIAEKKKVYDVETPEEMKEKDEFLRSKIPVKAMTPEEEKIYYENIRERNKEYAKFMLKPSDTGTKKKISEPARAESGEKVTMVHTIVTPTDDEDVEDIVYEKESMEGDNAGGLFIPRKRAPTVEQIARDVLNDDQFNRVYQSFQQIYGNEVKNEDIFHVPSKNEIKTELAGILATDSEKTLFDVIGDHAQRAYDHFYDQLEAMFHGVMPENLDEIDQCGGNGDDYIIIPMTVDLEYFKKSCSESGRCKIIERPANDPLLTFNYDHPTPCIRPKFEGNDIAMKILKNIIESDSVIFTHLSSVIDLDRNPNAPQTLSDQILGVPAIRREKAKREKVKPRGKRKHK